MLKRNTKEWTSLNNELKVLQNRQDNLQDDKGRYVLIRKDNRYLTQLKVAHDAHFRGGNYIIALGVGYATVEVRFTNFVMIYDHIDHVYIYKSKANKLKKLSIENDVLKAIWLFHIVDALNYSYQNKKVGHKKVLKFLVDQSQNISLDPKENVSKRSDDVTGGIDVRDVGSSMSFQGEEADFSMRSTDMLADRLGGFSPVIRSVTPVRGFSFLKEQSPPAGVFSKN